MLLRFSLLEEGLGGSTLGVAGFGDCGDLRLVSELAADIFALGIVFIDSWAWLAMLMTFG